MTAAWRDGLARRAGRWFRTALIALPVISLLIMLLAWLRYGIDLPTHDDWRSYFSGRAQSLDIEYLFRSSNDTLYPVGKALDALAQRYLDGNSIAYQFLSMLGVLGALLVLQWQLLRRSLGDRTIAACAFASTLFMLQPSSYWGWQNMAYHQALPLVFLLSALLVLFYAPWRSLPKAGTLLALGLASGFTYISGAFAALAMAMALLLFCALDRAFRARALLPVAVLLVAGLITSAMQIRVILVVQKGAIHKSDTPFTWPTDPDFWFYLLGKVARSLMLPASSPLVSLAIALAAALLVLAVAAAIVIRAWRGGRAPASDSEVIFVSLVAAIGAYALMIAAGRASLRSESLVAPLDIFVFGFARFHFFWLTIIWPWAIALLVSVVGTRAGHARALLAGTIVAAVAVAGAAAQGAFAHNSYFRDSVGRRAETQLKCILMHLVRDDHIDCPATYPSDLTRAYVYGVTTGASFARHLPPELMLLRRNDTPFEDMLRDPGVERTVLNAEVSVDADGAMMLVAGKDSQIVLRSGRVDGWKTCAAAELSADIEPEADDTAELFFLPRGTGDFSAANAKRHRIVAGEHNRIRLIILSHRGFEPGFRFDPVGGAQRVTVHDLGLRCLLRAG